MVLGLYYITAHKAGTCTLAIGLYMFSYYSTRSSTELDLA